MKTKTKYIFVTGGVISGVGKGIMAASIGAILKAKGLKVSMQYLWMPRVPGKGCSAEILKQGKNGLKKKRKAAQPDNGRSFQQLHILFVPEEDSFILPVHIIRQKMKKMSDGSFNNFLNF